VVLRILDDKSRSLGWFDSTYPHIRKMERKITKEAVEAERKKYINAIYGKRAMIDKKTRKDYNSKVVKEIIKRAKEFQKKQYHKITTSQMLYTDTDSVIIKEK